MIHLRSATFNTAFSKPTGFPFDIPIIRSLESIAFTSDVTFLVGDNGSGKSTLLETLACAVGSPTVGSVSVERDKTLADIRKLAKCVKLTWTKRTRQGFFMRSEDFFGYAKQQAETRTEMEAELRRVEAEYKDRSETARIYAKMPYQTEIGDMQRKYGSGLDSYSHGESFFKLFQSRFVPNGLYLLDEPEAPLSPMRQLSFITLMSNAVKRGAQLIIATHSPILMAYPGADILHFDGGEIRRIDYDDVEHVFITKSFLNNPRQYLKHLLEDDNAR